MNKQPTKRKRSKSNKDHKPNTGKPDTSAVTRTPQKKLDESNDSIIPATPYSQDESHPQFIDSPCVIVLDETDATEQKDSKSVGIQTSPSTPLITPPERRRLIKELAFANVEKAKLIEDLNQQLKQQRRTIRKLNGYLRSTYPQDFI
jgi:hypothetical protein